MTRLAPWLLSLALLSSLSACKKTEAETTAPTGHTKGDHHGANLEGREVVGNWAAEPGDVTTCPMSGEKFEVTADSPRYAYQGHEFKFCCPMCLEKTTADPATYLDPLVEQAGGPVEEAPAEEAPAEEAPAEEAPAE